MPPNKYSRGKYQYKSKSGGSTIGKLKKQVAKLVRESDNVERKFIDVAISKTFDLPFGTLAGQPIFELQEGVTSQTRVGKKVLVKSIYIRMGFRSPAASPLNEVVRMLIVRETFNDESDVAKLEDVLQVPTNIYSYKEVGKSGFVTVFDRFVELNSLGGHSVHYTEQYLTDLNIPMEYKSASQADGTVNNFFLWIISDALATPGLVLGMLRMRYTDS